MAKVELTRGRYARVDDADFGWVSKWKWHYTTRGYAARKQHMGMAQGKQIIKVIHMHRMIHSTPEGFETDHINRDQLDNRRENLRTATRSQNAFNVGLRPNNTSGYIGVSWNKQKKAWDSYIWKNNKKTNLGRFQSLKEAIRARRRAEEKWAI